MTVFFYFYKMSKAKAPIGMFDSGLGGLSVLKYVSDFLPRESFVYMGDSKYAPYGKRSKDEIVLRSKCITGKLLAHGVKLIVLACNTATAAAIEELRAEWPNIPFVGMEPAVKHASLMSKSGNIGVLATYGTLQGELFRKNQKKYGPYVKIHFREGEGLVELAENNHTNSSDAEALLTKYLQPMLDAGVDQLVLGCTHYPLFIPLIEKITKQKIHIIDPAEAIARRTKDLLMQHRMLKITGNSTENDFYTSGDAEKFKIMLENLMPYIEKQQVTLFNC